MYRWTIDLGHYGTCTLSLDAKWDQPGSVFTGTCGGRVGYFLDVVCGLDIQQVTPHQLHDALMSQTEATGMIAAGPQTQPRQMAKVTLVEGEIPAARQAA